MVYLRGQRSQKFKIYKLIEWKRKKTQKNTGYFSLHGL
jgi:hypothetical protein